MVKTRITFSEIIDGLPPDGDEGTIIGFDAEHNPYILKWQPADGCWDAVGSERMLMVSGTEKGFIVRHARVILIAEAETERAPGSAYFDPNFYAEPKGEESSLDTSRSSIGFRDDVP